MARGNRRQLIETIEPALKAADQHGRMHDAGQHDLFGLADNVIEQPACDTLPGAEDVVDWSDSERLRHEKETLGLYLTGQSLNIFSQIGIVMMVGLAAKNGILIVEFANQLRDRGTAFADAIHEASLIRFRPIVMTGITTAAGACR
ncbi:MAG: hypothetical protein HC807_08605 [Gammaproteobacteria bacterium]|nr:hypothetical protein [Gammaproteobacteria bacterium]